jgi:uncharacterized protein YjbI with pentapeptide repeats
MTESNPSDDPFAEFEDWLVDGPAGKWSGSLVDPLPSHQSEIVNANVRRVLNKEVWSARVDRFEAALGKLEAQLQNAKRAQYEIRFDFAVLSAEHCSLSDRLFPCSSSFRKTEFRIFGAVFDHSIFRGDSVSFLASKFVDGGCHFHQTRFDTKRIDFSHVNFGSRSCYFTGAEFLGEEINFRNVTFSGDEMRFQNARFGHASHSYTLTSFANAKLSASKLDFSRCHFSAGSLDLSSANLEIGHVDFSGAKMARSALQMSGLNLDGRLSTQGSHVGAASFRDCSFVGLTDWTDAKFGTIPDFRQTKLDRAPEVARMTVPAPVMTGWWPWSRSNDKEDVLNLRKLKAMAIAANDHEKDGEFFAYEMMAKRGVEHTTFWQLLFNTIYWQVSFYGQSYLRPLGWLASSFATFATIYALMAALPIGGWQSLAFGITYSFKNSLPFLGTLTRSVPSPDGHVSWFAVQLQAIKDAQPGPDWFTGLGTGQAMLSLFFFFFLLLGLRNKFRLK